MSPHPHLILPLEEPDPRPDFADYGQLLALGYLTNLADPHPDSPNFTEHFSL